MQKNDIIELEITDVSDLGQGIGRYENLVCFVSNALYGEKVRAMLTKVKSKYALAKCVEVIVPSPYKTEDICPHRDCGGCVYKNISYEAQLKLKQSQVMEKLYRLGGVSREHFFDIIGMDDPYHYRNKATMPISTCGITTQKGGIVVPNAEPAIGFYKPGSHDVVNCKFCAIQKKIVIKITELVREFMKKDHLTAYDEKWEKGLFRHMIVKIAESTSEIMIIFVINGKGIPNAEKLITLLDEAIADFPTENGNVNYSLESVIVNTNKGKSSVIMGEQSKHIAGKSTILEKLGDLKFEISPQAFYQVNPKQTIKLYEKVVEFANLDARKNVLDLYCGVGSIGLFCASKISKLAEEEELPYDERGQVVGIEIVKQAVIDANRNAVINNIVNARFICGKAEEELANIINGSADKDDFKIPPFKPDVLILDPPRSGCESSIFEGIRKILPNRIVYVSCESATLARDLAKLFDMGYKLDDGIIVDMFANTYKTETCVSLKL